VLDNPHPSVATRREEIRDATRRDATRTSSAHSVANLFAFDAHQSCVFVPRPAVCRRDDTTADARATIVDVPRGEDDDASVVGVLDGARDGVAR